MASNGETIALSDRILSVLGQPGAASKIAAMQRQAEIDELLAKRRENEVARKEEVARLLRELPLLTAAVDRALERAQAAERELEAAKRALGEANGAVFQRRLQADDRITALEQEQRASASPLIAEALLEFDQREQTMRKRDLERQEVPVRGDDGLPLWNLVSRKQVTRVMTNLNALTSSLGWIRECARQLRNDLPLMALTDSELQERIAEMRACIGDPAELS